MLTPNQSKCNKNLSRSLSLVFALKAQNMMSLEKLKILLLISITTLIYYLF
jgi:hypothetical protein